MNNLVLFPRPLETILRAKVSVNVKSYGQIEFSFKHFVSHFIEEILATYELMPSFMQLGHCREAAFVQPGVSHECFEISDIIFNYF